MSSARFLSRPDVVTVACFAVVTALAGCASTPRTTVTLLPILEPLGAQLEGCEHGTSADGAAVARCAGDVVFTVRQLTPDPSSSPRYYGDGVDLANNNAGRMTWEPYALKTSADGRHIDRGDVHAVDDDRVVVVLLGAERPTGDPQTKTEVSCQAPPSSLERCETLMGAFLAVPMKSAAAVEASRPGASSQGTLHGRALSLPTSCAVVEQDANHGRYACDDDARLFWMVTDSMEAASEQAAVAIQALSDGEEPQEANCALLDADTRCEATSTAIVGLGYIDQKPLVVVCLVPGGAVWEHGLCRSSFRHR